MDKSHYNASLTLKLYALAAILFGSYGGKVCPFLATLTFTEIFIHVALTFTSLFLARHFLLADHHLNKSNQQIKLDTWCFFIASIPLTLVYNIFYDFGLDSNAKVLFGMALFGFFTGCLLQLSAKLTHMQEMQEKGDFNYQLLGSRTSLVNQMIALVVFLLIMLTGALTMVAVKDIFWLKHNPALVADGTGQISVIKELLFIAAIVTGYAIAVMRLWAKVIKGVLLSQERALIDVSEGRLDTRLPIFSFDEFGTAASLTNSMLDSLQFSQNEVKTTRDVAIVSLSALAESRDNETGAHILRTQEYVKALAEQLSLSSKYKELLTPTYIELLYKSAPLHDVGKVGIPDNILLKPDKLTDEEFVIMKGHAQIGADALSIAEKQLGTSSFLQVAKEIAQSHHEKWDGSGYPKQLVGEDIPLSGRLMALADVYDALISKRVYKPAFSHDKAKGIILEGQGTHFDPNIVVAFLEVEDRFVEIAAHFQDSSDDIAA
ncbi:HD domain-containing protein [Psychromonas sp. 14N.309.X.WAT.B.A12]|uniref:HD-GYP domain-containing protein n=1 Tax=Psychromonas sp. 14N.309.X.WAT.B.A12 TaxID=2998322 RepID=UPI0025B05992|nr:HD domain-containing phosphohydrolase [Psychromonas sp. 14N.309.X.WAT.B.A12]MDN2662465.1 HD domain-containing protein [Psychromonas sp. 14N.309.X.WAT.B.A12]